MDVERLLTNGPITGREDAPGSRERRFGPTRRNGSRSRRHPGIRAVILSGPTSRPIGPAVATHGQPTQRGEGPVGEPGRQAVGGPEVQAVRGGVAGQLQVTVLVVEA